MSTLKSKPAHQEHCLRQERLVAEFSITGNATPASKGRAADIPGTMVLRTEGQTATADAVETLSWTTAVDNSTGNSVFGLLIDLGDNKADKLYSCTLVEVTSVSTSEVVTASVTPLGNIQIDISATGLNLASESPTFRVELEYREAL